MHAARSAVLLALFLAACGGESVCDRPRTPTPLDPGTTGTIAGTVAFAGTPPAMRPVQMNAECRALHAEPVLAGDALVADGRVENVFVWVKEGLGDRVFAVPRDPVVIDQKGCLYRPRVAGAQTCQPIEFRNSDAFLHNVRGAPRASSGWNFGMSLQGSTRTVRLEKPEIMVATRCDVHPWMVAYLGVLAHPFFAVTGPDGRFALPGVPAGDYVVAAWHERFGTREARASVRPGATAEVGFSYGP